MAVSGIKLYYKFNLVIIVFLVLSKWLVSGLTLGSVKG